MTEERKRQLLLGIILAGLAVAFLYRFAGAGPDGTGLGGSGAGEPLQLAAALGGIPEVPWERLEARAAKYDPKGRNLFDFGRIKPPPPTAEEREAMRKAREAEEQARRERQAKLLEQQKEAQERLDAQRSRLPSRPLSQQGRKSAGPPPPPNPTFQFIGYLGPTEDKIAVLLEGEDFYLGRVGEVIKEDFRIVEIGYEWIQVGYTDPVYEDQTRRIMMGN